MTTRSREYFFWDLFCAFSIVGIWPRFIEPSLLWTTFLKLRIPSLPQALKGLKLLQFSDLHFNSKVSARFIDRLVAKIQSLAPDLILFTGDFLCYGELSASQQLQDFLNRIHAPYGCFAVLGNHDYEQCVSINSNGDYDQVETRSSSLKKAFLRLFESIVLTKKSTERAKAIPLHRSLLTLLQTTPFKLLHNETVTLEIKDAKLNLCGLGEYMMGRVLLSKAFEKYDERYPGVILLHNPDAALSLKGYPGEVILSGHTHGGQVNLPWMWKKFTLLENIEFKKGLHVVEGKHLYINRGVGSVLPFRWFSPPEILLLTLA